MKKNVVRLLTFVLLILMVSGMFAGCAEKESELLRICVDLEYANGEERHKEENEDFLLTRLIEAGNQQGIDVPRDIEIEYLPMSGPERAAALQHIRTEVMSGGGPDIFICACNTKDPVYAEEALFTMPEKAMELGLFLALDDYMENSTNFAEWDRMNETVLEAGRNADGQQIIPLCYTIPTAVYRADEVDHDASETITWMDMVNSEDTALWAAAVWPANSPMTSFILGEVADYGEEELLFTEQELLQRFEEIYALENSSNNEKSIPVHYVEYLGQEFDVDHPVIDRMKEAYTMIPLYSDDGGVTAEITAYAAINRNTKRAEEAYRFLDYFMSYREQRTGLMYEYMIFTGTAINSGTGSLKFGNIPMYNELMSENHRIHRVAPNVDLSMTGWYLTDQNFAEFCEVRDHITNVKYRNELDKEFTQAYRDYYAAVTSGEDAEAAVTESYRQIQRLVRE